MTGTILVVEDEPIAAMDLQESLERMGHAVVGIVASGDEVPTAVLSLRPDVVIMDIHLKSYIDGIDAAARLRLLSSVPVIYVTAYPARSLMDRAMKTAPVAYLEKPIDESLLRSCIEKALSDLQPA